MEFISHSEAETEALGEKLARSLPEHGGVSAMYGERGAGEPRSCAVLRAVWR